MAERLRDLAANIIRVTRGAGRAFEIGMHAQALLKALAEYQDAVGHYPAWTTWEGCCA